MSVCLWRQKFAEFLFGLHAMGHDLILFLFCDGCFKENRYKILSWLCPETKWLWLLIVLFFSNKFGKFSQMYGDWKDWKGYHPYMFTNLEYVGKIVDRHFFDLSHQMAKLTCFVNNFITITEQEHKWRIYYWIYFKLFRTWRNSIGQGKLNKKSGVVHNCQSDFKFTVGKIWAKWK